MKRNKGKKRVTFGTETSYWKSMADVLMALLLVVLLILMILMFSVLNLEEAVPQLPVSAWEGGASAGIPKDLLGKEAEGAGFERQEENEEPERGGGSGGGGGEKHRPIPEEVFDGEDTGRAAVYVIVQDEESERPIRKSGIAFELYNSQHAQQILHVYYPKQIGHDRFVTTEDGTFYLPEKIGYNTYYLKNLIAPDGYDMADNVSFSVAYSYDWGGPCVVRVPMSPAKNRIRIQVTDEDERLTHGSRKNKGAAGTWQVVAVEDIVTADGTLRCKRGEAAAVIVCDEDGYGESEEIYLGEYRIVQEEIPFGYVAQQEEIPALVEKKGTPEPMPVQITAKKTEVVVQLCDEDDEALMLDGAEYELTDDTGGRRLVQTDAKGVCVISDLKKTAAYTLRQVRGKELYRVEGNAYAFYVDENGLIEGEATYPIRTSNRMIKASFRVFDRVLRRNMAGCACVLKNADGETVGEWSSAAFAMQVHGIEPGEYTLTVSGDAELERRVVISDKGGVQSFRIGIMTAHGTMLLAAAGILLAAVFLYFLLRRKGSRHEP